MRGSVLWDSSAVLALLDADDADHAAAADIARALARQKTPCFITNYIEAEAHALLLRKLGRTLAREWLLTGGLAVVSAHAVEVQRAKALIAKYSDKNWSLCDAISFVVIDARGAGAAFSFGHHFAQHGGFDVLGWTAQGR